MSYVHLHVHSQGSFAAKADGCAKPKDLVAAVAELKMSAMALTDHGSMIEVISSLKLGRDFGVKVLPGCEFYMVPSIDHMREEAHRRERYHLTLMAISDEGLTNLYRLHYQSYLNYYFKPNVDFNLLNKYNEGIVCLTGCPAGMFSEMYRAGKIPEAIKVIHQLKAIYGDRLYGEIQRIGIPELDRHVDGYCQIFSEQKLKIVPTNDVHFIKKEHNLLHDVAICIGKGMKLGDPNRPLKSCPETYLKSPEEMMAVFSDKKNLLQNTLEIADRCNISALGKRNLMPTFSVPANFKIELFKEDRVYEYLVSKVKEGLSTLVAKEEWPAAAKRCQMELATIKRMGYSSYFLIVADFIEWARSKGIPIGPGRGSAAGSLVCFCLKITTKINPMHHGLIFERFLNEGRKDSPPDIDIDVSNSHRQLLIKYVREKYGEQHVAIIGTTGTFKPKTCINDVARVLGIPESIASQISKSIPEHAEITFKMAVKESEKFKQYSDRADNPKTPDDFNLQKLFTIARLFEGNKRHVSKHAAGVVIAPEGIPVSDFLPVIRDSEDGIDFTAVDMHTCEDVGALKMDFLGIKNLDKVNDTAKSVGLTGYYEVADNCDLDDPFVYEKVFKGQDTIGVFQFEEGGMQGALQQFGGDCFNDLVVVVSAMRPGPKDEIPRMSDVKWGRRSPEYEHPLLEPILNETFGIILYQEQAIRIFVDLAGFTAVEADLARRAIGKKKPKEMEALRGKFYEGCKKNNINSEISKNLFAKIEKFADYSFNKSHAAAYATLAFYTAYCKAYYPAHYMAQCFNYHPMTKYKLFIEDCRRLKIPVLPPDVNCSKSYFSVEKFDSSLHKKNLYFDEVYAGIKDGTECIRFGYQLIKNVSAGLKLERQAPYNSLFSFLMANPHVNSKALEWLIRAGALDSFGVPRVDMLFNLEKLTNLQKGKKKNSSQKDLMDYMEEDEVDDLVTLEKGGELDIPKDRLSSEMECLGYGFTADFRTAFSNLISQVGTGLTVKDVCQPDIRINTKVTFVGMIYNVKCYRKKLVDKDGNKTNQLIFFVKVGDFEEQMELGLFENGIGRSSGLMQTPVSDMMYRKEDIVSITGTWKSNGKFDVDSIVVLERKE